MSTLFSRSLKSFQQIILKSKDRTDEDRHIPVVWAQGRAFITTDYVGGRRAEAQLKGTVYSLTGIKPDQLAVGHVVAVQIEEGCLNVNISGPRGAGFNPDYSHEESLLNNREHRRNLLLEEKDIVWVC